MTDDELKKLTLAGAAAAIAKREISHSELIEAVLARIERLNPEMRAFITVADRKIADAHTPPLHGVPLSVKDLFDTKDCKTTAGAKVFADRVPKEDATVVKKLREAG